MFLKKFDRGLYEGPLDDKEDENQYPFAKNPFTLKERIRYSLVALKAALLIGVFFLVGLFIAICLVARPWVAG